MTTDSRQLLDEHDDLSSEIEDIRKWASELGEIGQPRFGEMADRLERLGKHLAAHFAHEEEGGYLADAVGRAPQLSSRAEALLRQHRELADDLQKTVDDLGADEFVGTGWNEMCRDFDRFLLRWSEHERSERSLIQSALETDVRAGH